MGRLFTVDEAAALVRQHPVTLYGLIRDGALPAIRLGTRTIRIREVDLEDYLDRRSTKVGERRRERRPDRRRPPARDRGPRRQPARFDLNASRRAGRALPTVPPSMGA